MLNRLNKYREILLWKKNKVNIISKQIKGENLDDLLKDTIFLEKFIPNRKIIDIGSGNGILGIPIAVLHPGKKIILVDSRKKKCETMKEIIEELKINNCQVEHRDFLNFITNYQMNEKDIVFITRGFPNLELLIKLIIIKRKKRLIVITSKNKMNLIKKGMVNINKQVYNIPHRNNLVLMIMEYVSRETF